MTSEHKEADAGNTVVNGLVLSSNGQDKDLDPAKVCTGKGTVTLWASPACEENQSTSPTYPQNIQQSENDWKLLSSIDSNGEAQPSALAAKGYRSVRPNLSSEGKPHDATCSTITPAQTEVIVVPLHQVHLDRGQEANSSTPPPPLVPFGQSAAFSENVSTGLPLTFPTLDDFIPPHLQKGPHHNQPSSSSGTVPHVRPKLPSLSPPPPPLIPPVTEVPNRVLEPESTGIILHTDLCPLLNEAPRPSSGTECYGSLTFSSKPSSAYPSTTIVNPTIVLLQHNREPLPDLPISGKVDCTPIQEKENQSEKQEMEEQKRVAKSSPYIVDSSLDDFQHINS